MLSTFFESIFLNRETIGQMPVQRFSSRNDSSYVFASRLNSRYPSKESCQKSWRKVGCISYHKRIFQKKAKHVFRYSYIYIGIRKYLCIMNLFRPTSATICKPIFVIKFLQILRDSNVIYKFSFLFAISTTKLFRNVKFA